MQKHERGLTIFTPTYNRGDMLLRLYNSLLKQNVQCFEWLIVDDGSTDNTKEKVENFINDGKIAIRYIYKENGGKHTALNIGMHRANREYFVCIDSDDFMTDTAVKDIMECIDKVHPDCIIAYKSEVGKEGIIGDEFPFELEYSTLFELSTDYSCGGDKALIHKTELLENIYFPEPAEVKFFPESYIYDLFDRKNKSFLLRKSVCVCEYLRDGYSANYLELIIRNSLSMKILYAERLDFPCSFKQRFTFAFRYDAFAMLSRSKEGNYKGRHKIILLMAFPLGVAMYILYLIYKRKMFRFKKADER